MFGTVWPLIERKKSEKINTMLLALGSNMMMENSSGHRHMHTVVKAQHKETQEELF